MNESVVVGSLLLPRDDTKPELIDILPNRVAIARVSYNRQSWVLCTAIYTVVEVVLTDVIPNLARKSSEI